MILSTIIQALITAVFIILILGLLGLIIYFRIDSKRENKYKMSGKEKRLIIKHGSLMEDRPKSILSDESVMLFEDYKEILNLIKNDSSIDQVILDVDNMVLSSSQIEEIRPIFESMAKDKEIISIGSFFTKVQYKIALLGQKIYLLDSNNSKIFLRGYSYSDIYKKPLLDKLGIKLTPIHIGDYKVAGESFGQETMSYERKESLYKTGDDQEQLFIDLVKDKRGLDITQPMFAGDLLMLNRHEAKNLGLIDGEKSYEDLGFYDKDQTVYLKKYRHNYLKDKPLRENKDKYNIGVLHLAGNIIDQSRDESFISFKNVKNKIDQLKKYKNLQGLVVHIDSPGGSALEAERIYRLIKDIDLPVYISMGDYCASGGYYIACGGDKLFANKNTLTGSIGVVSLYPQVKEAMDKIGLNNEMVARGKGQDLYNPFMDLSDESKDLIIKNMEEVYSEFKSRVMTSRNMEEDLVEKLGGGRVYMGEEALKLGLIDQIGSLDKCIESLVEDENISSPKILHIREELSIEDLKERLKNKYSFLSMEDKLETYKNYLYQPLFLETKKKE